MGRTSCREFSGQQNGYFRGVREFFPDGTFDEPDLCEASEGAGLTHGNCCHFANPKIEEPEDLETPCVAIWDDPDAQSLFVRNQMAQEGQRRYHAERKREYQRSLETLRQHPLSMWKNRPKYDKPKYDEPWKIARI